MRNTGLNDGLGSWIDCNQQLPPTNIQVLVFGENIGELENGVTMEIVIWDGDIWWEEGGTELSSNSFRWTHWMRLPKPPIVDKK